MLTVEQLSSAAALDAFYSQETVFLTGATGVLGGCLLYKLLETLPTSRIYVLVRGSAGQAIAKWRSSMPDQVPAILAANNKQIVFVVGDMTLPSYGIESGLLARIRSETTTVIHSAANIAFTTTVAQALRDNTLPAMAMAEMALTFPKLRSYVQVSTCYSNSHMGAVSIPEAIHAPGDMAVEDEFRLALETGTTPLAKKFPWAYAYSKNIMERLLTERYPQLPLMIARPTSIGPAIAEPFDGFCSKDSMPMHSWITRQMSLSGGDDLYHGDGSNPMNELPVDLVANGILLHVALGTRGPLHLSSECWRSYPTKQVMETYRTFLPRSWTSKMAPMVWDATESMPRGKTARFWGVVDRNMGFESTKMLALKGVRGPLAMDVDGFEYWPWFERRVQVLFRDLMVAQAKKDAKARQIQASPPFAEQARL